MTAINGAPSHILLNRKDNAASHSTRPQTKGASGAFASYGFGPLDLPDNANKAGVEGGKKAASGTVPASGPMRGNDIGWLTTLSVSQNKR